jgi:hypothetical protein
MEEKEIDCEIKLADCAIDYPLIYVNILGCHTAGVCLAFLLSFMKVVKKSEVKMTDEILREHLGINFSAFRSAKKRIENSGILSIRSRGPLGTFYKYNKSKHVELVNEVKP